MAEIRNVLSLKNENKVLEVSDVDNQNEVCFQTHDRGAGALIYLNKGHLISLRKHIDYLINKQ